MNCQTLLDTIRTEIPLIYTCEEVASYRLRLNTPFLYPNGDYIDLYLEETPAGLYLTDLGETLGYLSDHGISFLLCNVALRQFQDRIADGRSHAK